MKKVLYSYALDAEGRRQSINHTDAPRPFQCGDCEGEMVAKRGEKNRWHFAHKANLVCEPKPDPDNALHRYAQDIIFESFSRHRADGIEYVVGVKCSGLSAASDYPEFHGCEKPVVRNAAEPDAQIIKEYSLIPNTRSDLVIKLSAGKALILEVVNTHAPEDKTLEQYREAGYPVFIKKVYWGSLDELHTGLVADEAINVPEVLCSSCKSEKRRTEEELATRQEDLQRRRRIIDAVVQKLVRRRSPAPKFCPWYQVYKPSWGTNRPVLMYPKIQRPVFANAIILTEMGFTQHNTSKPHLFSYEVRKSPRIVLYADLGGSDVVPIYKDTAAMLYAPDLEDDPEIEQYVIDRFGEILQKEGVNVRTGFESSAHIEQIGDVNPVGHVSKAMLDGLIGWDNTCKTCQAKAVYQGECRQCGAWQGKRRVGTQDENHDVVSDLMADYPGKPVRSPAPRSWVSDNYE